MYLQTYFFYFIQLEGTIISVFTIRIIINKSKLNISIVRLRQYFNLERFFHLNWYVDVRSVSINLYR